MTSATYGEVMHDELCRLFGRFRHGAELLARAALATPRTAENWLAGKCAPSGQALIHLMAANQELEARVIALVREERDGLAKSGCGRGVGKEGAGAGASAVAGRDGIALASQGAGAAASVAHLPQEAAGWTQRVAPGGGR